MVLKFDVLLIQIIHVVILIFLFNKFFGKELSQALLARKKQIADLENIEQVCNDKIKEADAVAEWIIHDANEYKKRRIVDVDADLEKYRQWQVQDLERELDHIKETARQRLLQEKKELEDGFVSLVKQTASKVLRKIWTEKVVQDAYFETVVADIVKK